MRFIPANPRTRVRRRYRLVVFGYVVMPEHVHLLLSEPQRATLSTAIQALKLGFVRSLEGGADSQVSQKRRDLGHPQRRWLQEVKPILAGTVLRFQRLDGEEANRKTALHPPQSGGTRIGGLARTMALEQFPLVFVRRSRPSPNQRHGHSGDDNPPASSVIGWFADSSRAKVGCPMSRRVCETWE